MDRLRVQHLNDRVNYTVAVGGNGELNAPCSRCHTKPHDCRRDSNGARNEHDGIPSSSFSLGDPFTRIDSASCPTKCRMRSHRGTAHNQSRTVHHNGYHGSTSSTSINYHNIYSKLTCLLVQGQTEGRLCGLTKGINVRPSGFYGIIRITLVVAFLTYLCIPSTLAAPRRHQQILETSVNQSRIASEIDQLMALLRQELPQVSSTGARKDPPGSPSTRTGRSGRRGFPNRQGRVLTQEEIFPRIGEEIRNASCQPRDMILDAYHELGVDRGYGHLLPECIVVKRCKNGGCCQEHQECRSSDFVFKTFYFLQNVNSDPIVHDIREDTACECRDICELSKEECPSGKTLNINTCSCECPKKCPHPFLLNDRCECDCLMSNKPCKFFYRGKRGTTLAQADCSCVRRGECQSPPCANGQFSMQRCRCINSSS